MLRERCAQVFETAPVRGVRHGSAVLGMKLASARLAPSVAFPDSITPAGVGAGHDSHPIKGPNRDCWPRGPLAGLEFKLARLPTEKDERWRNPLFVCDSPMFRCQQIGRDLVDVADAGGAVQSRVAIAILQ